MYVTDVTILTPPVRGRLVSGETEPAETSRRSAIVYYKFFFRPLILLVILLSYSAAADQSQYGNTTFPNSGADDAQASFMQGLLMLHSFEYSDARKAFQEAQSIDKDFAMAYWGEALTHYRVLWNEIELDKATAALNELAATPAEVRRHQLSPVFSRISSSHN